MMPVVGSSATDGVANQDFLWTWRLLTIGFRLDECGEIRRCSEDELLKHVRQAIEAGLRFQLEWVFSPPQIEEVQAKLSHQGGEDSKSVVNRLSFSLAQPRLLVLLAYLKSRKHNPFAIEIV